jgi:hypothetical protein
MKPQESKFDIRHDVNSNQPRQYFFPIKAGVILS